MQLAFQIHAVTRHCETADEIDYGAEDITLHLRPDPFAVARSGTDDVEEIVQSNDRDQGRILRKADEVVDDAGDGNAERLGHDDEARGLPIAETNSHGALILPLAERLQPATHHF